MRIAAVERALPSRRVTNAWILEELRRKNRDRLAPPQLAALVTRVERGLLTAGTEVRYHLDERESAFGLVAKATRGALARAQIAPADVDLLIYTGVGRGWIEPAMMNPVQRELGLVNATGFDLMDACASWLRGVHVAHTFLRAGVYRNAVVVNCEAGIFRQHAAWEFDRVEDLEHRFAAFTIGEAATATVLTNENPADDFYFTFKTFGEHFARCIIPLAGAADFVPSGADTRLVPGRFFALSTELFIAVTELIVTTWKADPRLDGGRYDVAFGHEASEKLSADITRACGVYDVYFPTHRRFGNTVSASIPLGMSVAEEEGRLKRGDRVVIIVGSAGISVAFATFTY
jgi:3-oxoacyl-[acyl-carrier-protein] synthase III